MRLSLHAVINEHSLCVFSVPLVSLLWYSLPWRLSEGRKDLKESLWWVLNGSGTLRRLCNEKHDSSPSPPFREHLQQLCVDEYEAYLSSFLSTHVFPWFVSSCDLELTSSHLSFVRFFFFFSCFSFLFLSNLQFLYGIHHGPGHFQQLNGCQITTQSMLEKNIKISTLLLSFILLCLFSSSVNPLSFYLSPLLNPPAPACSAQPWVSALVWLPWKQQFENSKKRQGGGSG